MGHFSKQIADEIYKPAKVSLSGTPNFLEFEARMGDDTPYQQTQEVLKLVHENELEKNIENVYFTIKEAADSGQRHTFRGTTDKNKVDDKTFFVANNNKSMVVENIRACLLKNTFFRNRFSINIPYTWDGTDVQNGDTIVIQSLGSGDLYKFEIEKLPNLFSPTEEDTDAKTISPFLECTNTSSEGYNSDLIDAGLGDKDIEVEVYTNTGVFLGKPDHPTKTVSPGILMTTLTKSYAGDPVWFDINSLLSTNKKYSDDFLEIGTPGKNGQIQIWVDAGTMSSVRLIARTNDSINRETFYYSDILYAITGYARTLEKVDMNDYIFHRALNYTGKLKPLTHQPVLTHIKGQTQYFNFILNDPQHKMPGQTDLYNIGIYYEFYTQSGKFIASQRSLMQAKDEFFEVNTTKLDLDVVIEAVEAEHGLRVGTVKVCLCDDANVASQPIEFRIMPDCLYTLNDFAFLNALGGWSSFNFGGEKTVTLKSDASTYHQALKPEYKLRSKIETVLDKEVEETFSVKTSPITAKVADWLKELSASIAVYELSTGRYVVVDSFEVKHTTKDDLFVLEMKYRYSDTFNGAIK